MARLSVLDRLDASLALSPEEILLVDTVRVLAAREIGPRAAQYDRSGEFPWDNVAALNKLGLNAMFVPEQYGGEPVRTWPISPACAR